MEEIFLVFLLCFVPLFVAIDAPGTLPLVLSFTEGMKRKERFKVINTAILTASIVGLAFLFAGEFVLNLLAISVGHFAIAGGILLLALSLRDLVAGKLMETPLKEEMISVVPIGTPLTVGPATLTTLLLLTDEYGLGIVLWAFVLNLFIAWVIFLKGEAIAHFLGQGGLRAISKLASLLLAAIAVRMIVKGITLLFPTLT